MEYKGFTLDAFQERAIRSIDQGRSVLISAPTGCGKTLIAEFAVDQALADGRKIIYTAPIKALSNQKFRDFSAEYGDRIGIKTGDVSINPDAPVIIMTTEIFRNSIFDNPEALADVSFVIFDEIHYLDDPDRGSVWEESIIFAPPHIRFICLSATVPNVDDFADWIRSIRDDELDVVKEHHRPVPLRHTIHVPSMGTMSMKDLKKLEHRATHEMRRYLSRTKGKDARWQNQLIEEIIRQDHLPCLFFIFNRHGCEQAASRCSRYELLSADERREALDLFDRLATAYQVDDDPTAQQLRSMVGRGIAYHHAGILPTLKDIIERIFTTGYIKLIFTTETFALGINMPARSVAFESVLRYNGRELVRMKTRDHQQMSGRAGRRGLDTEGWAYSTVEWPNVDYRETEAILFGDVEPIRSQFNLGYATLLNLYDKMGERLFDAAEKSFYNYQRTHNLLEPPSNKNDRKRRQNTGRGRRSKKWKQKKAWDTVRSQIENRLDFLRDREYVRHDALTEKGQFARQIQGYEIQTTELVFRNMLQDLDPDQLNAVACALSFEGKKREFYQEPDRREPFTVYEDVTALLTRIRKHEFKLKIKPAIQAPDFRLTTAILNWSRGKPFGILEQFTSASDGDIVRAVRMTIQILRQLHWVVRTSDPAFSEQLLEALRRINRDVVDAEKQLRQGSEEMDPEPR
jgi:superfamily II RNA helicase